MATRADLMFPPAEPRSSSGPLRPPVIRHRETPRTVTRRRFLKGASGLTAALLAMPATRLLGVPEVEAALPTTLSGVKFPRNNYNCGPFLSSKGNVYALMRDGSTSSKLAAMKTSNPETGPWSKQHSAGAPNVGGEIVSSWAFQDGDLLHIATFGAADPEVRYHAFSLATDRWVTVNETIEGLVNRPGLRHMSVCVNQRSDGDLIVLYSGSTDLVNGAFRERVDYARREGGSWAAGISLADDTLPLNWASGTVVRGSQDRMHCFFVRGEDRNAYQRCVQSDNTLEPFPAPFDEDGGGIEHCFTAGAAYVDGDVTKVRVPYKRFRTTDLKMACAAFDSADVPAVTPILAITELEARITERTVVAASAAHGNTLHLLYADATNFDLRHAVGINDDWTETAVVTGTINRLSCNVYVRSGLPRLAHLYDDAGVIKYNEITL